MRMSPKAVSIVVGATVLLSTVAVSFVAYTTPSTAQYVPAVGWDAWIDGTPGYAGSPGTCGPVPGAPAGSADLELRYPHAEIYTWQDPNNMQNPPVKYLIIHQVFRNCGAAVASPVYVYTTKLPGFTFTSSSAPGIGYQQICTLPSWQNPAYPQWLNCGPFTMQPPPWDPTNIPGTGGFSMQIYTLPSCASPQSYAIPMTSSISVSGALPPDPNPSNNGWSGTLHLVCTPPTSSSSTSPYPPATADVKISPFFSADLVGDEIVLTATVKNLGPALTNNVTLNATIPGLTRIPQNNCNPVAGNTNAYTCPIGTLTNPANAYPVSSYTDTRIHVMKFQMPTCTTPQYISIPVSMTVTHSTTDPVPSNNAMSRTLYIWCSAG